MHHYLLRYIPHWGCWLLLLDYCYTRLHRLPPCRNMSRSRGPFADNCPPVGNLVLATMTSCDIIWITDTSLKALIATTTSLPTSASASPFPPTWWLTMPRLLFMWSKLRGFRGWGRRARLGAAIWNPACIPFGWITCKLTIQVNKETLSRRAHLRCWLIKV